MASLGLVYKRKGQAYIGIFQDSFIESFRKLHDSDNLYDNLEPEQFMVVNVLDSYDLPDMTICAVQLLSTITMIGKDMQPIDVVTFLNDMVDMSMEDYQEFMEDFYEHLCVN